METAQKTRNGDKTRREILRVAYDTVRKRGFHASNLDEILAKSGFAKGTFYHHFPNKKALGCAIVDEVLMPEIARRWVDPLEHASSPLAALRALIEKTQCDEVEIEFGCPLNTLSQELSSQDGDFHARLSRIYDHWRHGTARALKAAQACGELRSDIEVEATAALIVSGIEGALAIAKASRSLASLQQALSGLLAYLDNLRA